MTTTFEPFIAAFTGQLTVFKSQNGMSYTFHQPYPRVEKNRAYMMELDIPQNRIKMIPVIG
jgi:hypothetical protein